MAKGEPVGRHTRRTGLIVASSAFLLGAGVVGFFIATSKSRPADVPKPVISDVPAMTQPPTALPPVDLGTSQPGGPSIVEVRGPTIQFIDKQDPARVAGQLQWESLDPLDNGRSAITKPVGYYYLRNGAVVQIKAAKGRIYTPARSKQPESGTFDGGVVFSLFEPDAAGKLDVAKDKPTLRAETRSLDFDLATGDVSSPDPFTITSDLVEAKGKGFQVLYNQVSEAINLLQINEQAAVTIHPEAARRKHTALKPDKPAATAPSDEPAPLQRVAMYRALFSTSVKITQAQRTITGDEMEVFLRLVNNQLPARAFGERGDGTTTTTPAATNTRPDQQLLTADQPITLTWVGKLTVRPLETAPRELEADHLLARITGSQTGPARAADDSLRASALATTFQIGATTRDLVVSGKPGAPARLAAAGRGTLTTPQLRLNLGTGLGTLDGPGELVGDPTTRELAAGPVLPDRRASWTDRAEIQLSADNDALTGQLEVATFLGGVVASSRAGEVRSDLARITFSPVADKASATELAAVNLRGNVRAQAGHGEADAARGILSADAVDVRFEPTDATSDPVPVELLAQGNVKASRQDQALSAAILSAALGRDSHGDVQLRTAQAESNVVFTGAKGLKATTNRLDADADAQTVLLTGAGTQITRDASTLDGEQFLLRGKSRELMGAGPGTFTHARGNSKPAAGSPQAALPNQVTAAWQHSLYVNDPDGQAIVEGGAVVTAAGDQETSTLKAAQVIINFTPLPIAAEGSAKTEPAPERKFVSADAVGSLNPNVTGVAVVESRRYTDADALLARDDKKLERLLYLESARISASEADGIISVPQTGKLLVADKRPPTPQDPAAPKPTKPGAGDMQLAGAHGTSLFSWQGDLILRRNAGTIEMHRKTRLIHQPEGQDTPFLLDADNMTAWFSQNGTAVAAAPNARNTQLLKATAEGSVLAESADQRLTADLLSFDVPTNTIEAAATGSNNVVLSDKTRPSP
ncbi:MAG: hypothetical protein ACREJO_15175, partial [Phycisphaerales bacterium]